MSYCPYITMPLHKRLNGISKFANHFRLVALIYTHNAQIIYFFEYRSFKRNSIVFSDFLLKLGEQILPFLAFVPFALR